MRWRRRRIAKRRRKLRDERARFEALFARATRGTFAALSRHLDALPLDLATATDSVLDALAETIGVPRYTFDARASLDEDDATLRVRLTARLAAPPFHVTARIRT